ncbi:MAG: hypothetical protein M9894_23680 [Planctomycetes bacterium]|nr:hypothetical protein [Planctomycetota bacterium]
MLAPSLRGDARVRVRLRHALASHDPAAVEAALREAARRGAPPPDDLLDVPLARPGRVLDVDLPLDVWAELPDGRTLRVGSTPCLGGAEVPAHLSWWVTPAGPIAPDALADAVEQGEVAGVALDGPDARAQLAAVLARRPATLRRLSVTLDDLGPALLGQVAALPGLEGLTLHDRQLADDGLRALAPATGLRELSVVEGAFDDAALAALAGLTRLRRLELRLAPLLRGPGLATVAGLPRLERLSLAFSPELQLGVAELAVASRLRSLDLRGCWVGDDGLRALVRGPVARSLRELSLGCYGIDDRGFGLLPALEQLESLSIFEVESGDAAMHAAAALPGLRCLELVTGEVSERAASRPGGLSLERLRLFPARLAPGVVSRIVRRSPFLRELVLGVRCPPADGEVISALARCRDLEELELTLTARFTISALSCLQRLRRLRLRSPAAAGDLHALVRGFPALRALELDVSGIPSHVLESLSDRGDLESLTLIDQGIGDDCCSDCDAALLARGAALGRLVRALSGGVNIFTPYRPPGLGALEGRSSAPGEAAEAEARRRARGRYRSPDPTARARAAPPGIRGRSRSITL